MRIVALVFVLLWANSGRGAESIAAPKLVFDSMGVYSRLERCIVDQLVRQSPDRLKRLVPAGNFNPIASDVGSKAVVEMSAVGYTMDGTRRGYRVRFATADGTPWRHFQSESLIGVYAATLSTDVVVLDYSSLSPVFIADITACR